MLRFAADENVGHAVTSCPDTQVTVVFLNSYDMQVARNEWKAGRYPGHHLYGTAGIADPFVVQDVVRTGRHHGALAGALSARFGDIELQVVTSVSRGQQAIVYSADADLLRLLSLARRGGSLVAANLLGFVIVSRSHDANKFSTPTVGLTVSSPFHRSPRRVCSRSEYKGRKS